MELICLVNLVFSIAGFYFIVRMWKEVKSRRDFYGENFGIPRGKERKAAPLPQFTAPKTQGVSAEQLAALIQAYQAEAADEAEEPQPQVSQDDMAAILRQIAQTQGAAS